MSRDSKHKQRPLIINVYPNPSPAEVAAMHPCELGYHRPAHLVDGGTACGVCGRYL